MVTKSTKMLVGGISTTPIVVGCLIGYSLDIMNSTLGNVSKIVIIRNWWDVLDSIVLLFTLLATLTLYYLIFNQVLSQKKSVEMQMDELKLYKTQLEYTKDDFDRRNKILILEVSERFNNIRNESRWQNTVKLIRDSNNTEYLKRDLTERCDVDNNMDVTIQDLRFVFDSCEDFFIKCNLLNLDLNIIDELMGIEIYDIFRNDVIWKYKEKLQASFPDGYTNIDSLYPKIKKIREKKNV